MKKLLNKASKLPWQINHKTGIVIGVVVALSGFTATCLGVFVAIVSARNLDN